LLLPPRSALWAIRHQFTLVLLNYPYASLLTARHELLQWLSIRKPFKHSPFSGHLHSAGELLHTP